MARPRDPRRDEAFEIWKASGGSIDLVDIAAQLDVSAGTVRGWKSKDKWESKLNGTFQTNKRNVPKNKERSNKRTERAKPQRVTEIESEDLTDKQRLFVMEYMRDFNITRAAMAAGYSKRSAHVVGWDTLKNPKVQAEVQRLKEVYTTKLGLDIQRIISEYMKIAFADITDYAEFGQQDMPLISKKGPVIDPKTGEVMTVKESFVAFRDHSMVDGTVISEVKQGRDGVSIKLHDKMRALKELEKYTDHMTEEQRLKVSKLRGEVALIEKQAGANTEKVPLHIIVDYGDEEEDDDS